VSIHHFLSGFEGRQGSLSIIQKHSVSFIFIIILHKHEEAEANLQLFFHLCYKLLRGILERINVILFQKIILH